MIVADTNTIAYLYLPTDQIDSVVSLLHKDPHWIAPLLWRSELRNAGSMDVLKRATKTGCSAYDCEFVALAKSLNTNLVTGDQKLVQTFPEYALTVADYLRT